MEFAALQLDVLKKELEGASLDQRQHDKDLDSMWIQTRMQVEPMIESNDEALKRKVDGQKQENQSYLKQLIELKKQHNILHAQVNICRTKVHELRSQVG